MELQLHQAQMGILRHLLLNRQAGFAEMQKQVGLSSDLFNYHLSCLLKSDYLQKSAESYELTIKGKEFANRMDTERSVIEKQAKLGVMLIIEKNEAGKKYLLIQKRLKQPYYGFEGFVTGKIGWGEQILTTAERELREETGLTAKLEYHYTIHEHIYLKEDGRLLEDKFFFVVGATQAKGELISLPSGENNWVLREDFFQHEKVYYDEFELLAMYDNGEHGFIEKEYFIEEF